MVSKVLLALCFVLAVAAAIPAGGAWPPTGAGWPPAGPSWPPAGPSWSPAGANPWLPPWVASAPWFPQWVPCTTVGASCLDCSTKLVCTKMGAGIQKDCRDPTLPYCNLGECSATPSDECAEPVVPLTTTA